MTVVKKSILGPPNPFDDGVQGVDAGVTIGDLTASPIGTATHGDEAAYRAAQARALGEKPGGSAGFGLAGSTDSGFSTYAGDGGPADRDGDTPGNASGYGKGIAGSMPLSTRPYNGSDTPSETSEYGKEIG